jgi:N-methylhydantoinase A/oxoprolinase/acetone carboxylase beta subunit
MYLSVEIGGALTDLVLMAEDETITTTKSANTSVPDVERCANLKSAERTRSH